MASSEMRDLVNPPERVESYRRRGLWTPHTLASQVSAHAAASPDAIAVIDDRGRRRHTYGELCRDAAAVATRLTAAGAGPGRTVSLQLPNCYEAVVCAVAIQSVGAVINPLLPNYRARELTHVFRIARPVAVITPGDYRSWNFPNMIDEARHESGVHPLNIVHGAGSAGDVALEQVLAGADPDHPLPHTRSAVSELIFTSGTEATPKAIMHTEENANLAVRTTFADIGVQPGDLVWMPSPVGHSTGFNYGVRAALYHGRTLVLQDQWNASDAVDLIQRFGPSYTLAATTFLRDLVEECERTGTRLPQLRHFGCGGAPVPPELVDRAEAAGICVLRLYGSTEVLCATWNRPGDPLDKRKHTDGRALSNTEIDIRDEHGASLTRSVAGELHIRGPQSSVGFFADPERTQATYLPDGWIRSGDLAELDDDGHLTIVGRKKEIIIRGGVNIAPREIEDMLCTFPEVERAAVIGLPDERLGERTCAVVVLRPGARLPLETMVDRLRTAGLATYKLPQVLHVLPRFPTTPSGKVQKHEIVRWVTEGPVADTKDNQQ
jgi:acyl-coenzyme A synthetase/AMP-(fatty) acid ligase